MVHRLLVLLLVLSGCGPSTGTSSLASFAGAERAYWKKVAPTCADRPSKAGCDDGDMVLFGGLLCATGEPEGCALVRASQSADGRWWRSPRRNPDNLGDDRSFSRDMAMGVFLYLTATHDTDAASRWLGWIDSNRPCIQKKPFSHDCLIRGPHRYCSDERAHECTLTPASWALMGRVWDALGLGRNDEMTAYKNSDIDTLTAEAQHVDTGYAMHLIGVEVLLKQKLQTLEATRQKAAGTLAGRQPGNPFFVFLRDGATDEVKARVLELCPKVGSGKGNGGQWAWERDTDAAAWEESMGWDCVFMANLVAGGPYTGGDEAPVAVEPPTRPTPAPPAAPAASATTTAAAPTRTPPTEVEASELRRGLGPSGRHRLVDGRGLVHRP